MQVMKILLINTSNCHEFHTKCVLIAVGIAHDSFMKYIKESENWFNSEVLYLDQKE